MLEFGQFVLLCADTILEIVQYGIVLPQCEFESNGFGSKVRILGRDELVLFLVTGLVLCDLPLEHAQTGSDFLDHDPDLFKIISRILELALCLELLELIFLKSENLFDHKSALLGSGTDKKITRSLIDDSESTGAETRAGKEIDDILCANIGFVQCVGRVAVAGDFPTDGYFVKVERKEFLAVVEVDADLCYSGACTFWGAGEDKILRFGSAKILRFPFAKDPPDRIDDV